MPRPSRRIAAVTLVAGLVSTALVGVGVVSSALVGVGHASAENGRKADRVFERLATFPIYLNSADPTAETVAEITAASDDGRTLISTDSAGERVTFTDITDPRRPQPAGELAVGGEPTSVAVYRSYALIVVDTSVSFAQPSGKLLVVSLPNRSVRTEIDLGGQPDSIAVSPAGARGGAYAAIALENERDELVNDGAIPQLPGGLLVTVGLSGEPADWKATPIPLSPSLAGVSGIVAPEDPEPEYVTINMRNELAVTLQENNGIAIIDLATSKVLRGFTAGTVDLTGIDTVEDDTINPSGSVAGLPREPDGIAWIGTGLLATANEGDLAGGSRGWSIFDATTGAVIWDAGNTLERIAISVGLYPESRSENKGTEPENITVDTIDGRRYAFVGAERGNFVAVYDLSDPRSPKFGQVLPVTNGPEGLLVIPTRGLFIASSEVDEPEDNIRSTIAVFRLGHETPEFPTIKSSAPDGVPIGWGALSGLTADPQRSDRLWSISDGYYAPTKLLSISTAKQHSRRGGPAIITSALTVTENGVPLAVDGEGIAARRGGGFWLAAEGADGPGNEILLLDANAAVQRRVRLPDEVANTLDGRGLEGIAVTGSGTSEQVLVVLQSPLTPDQTDTTSPNDPAVVADPADVARIGRYQVATGAWSWYGYPLDEGSIVGLSELVSLGGNRFAVVERDNLAGPAAAVKRLYTIDLDEAYGPAGRPLLTKILARDLLPDLRAGNGWVQERVDGLTVGGNGRVYLVTDNDGVEDATGETVFLDLGSKMQVFGRTR